MCNLGEFYFHSSVANAVSLHIRTDNVSVGTHRILPQSAHSVHSILFLSELSPSQQAVVTKPTEQRDWFGAGSGALCENQSVNEALWQFWHVLSCVPLTTLVCSALCPSDNHPVTPTHRAPDWHERDLKAHLPTGVSLTAALHQLTAGTQQSNTGNQILSCSRFSHWFFFFHKPHPNLTTLKAGE